MSSWNKEIFIIYINNNNEKEVYLECCISSYKIPLWLVYKGNHWHRNSQYSQYKIRKAYLRKQHCPTTHHRPQAAGWSPGCWMVLWSSGLRRGSWRRNWWSARMRRWRRRWFSRLPIGRGLQISGSYWGYSYLIHLNIKLFYQQHLSTFPSYLGFPIFIYIFKHKSMFYRKVWVLWNVNSKMSVHYEWLGV